MLVQTNMGPLPYEAIVAQINARYAEGKTPDLAVKSALQLGIDPAIIATLPGVDENAMRRGLSLISSGAFSEAATGTSADIQTAAPVGSAQYNARKAAGLDAFGFPAEEVSRLTAAGLYGPGRQFDPGDIRQDGLMESPLNFNDLNFEFVQEESGGYFAPIDLGNNTTVTKTNAGQYEISGPQGGAIYDANGALLNSYVRTGPKTGTMFDPQGNVVGSIDSSSRINEVLSDVFTPLAPAIPAILGTLALGPAGSGLLSGPAAAAAASGGNTLLQGGNIEDALKAAALAGVTAYGFGEVFPTGAAANTDAAFIAADAAQLAAQGLGEAQITAVLQAAGVAPSIAGNVAAAAAEGLNPQQIINEVGNLRFTSPTIASEGALSSLDPNRVIVSGQTVTGQPFDLATLGAGLFTAPVAPTVPVAPAVGNVQTTTVEGTRIQPDTSGQTVASVVPALVSAAAAPTATAPTQRTTVEGTKVTQPSSSMAGVGGAIIPSLTAAVPSAAEQVQVTGTRETPTNITIPALSAALPAIPAAVKATLPEPVKPPAKKEDSLFQPSDILKLLTLLGGTAAVGGTGSGTIPIGSVPPSDRMIGSTTPQFGPDYYAAVQRYYNAYMPETPRNVAGPLQQWYENKYGA